MHFPFPKYAAAGLICAALPLAAAQAEELTQLPKLNLDPHVTVSGLSSGAFMTVQLQTAFSAAISGVGVVSGGPFDCAGSYAFNPMLMPQDQRIMQAVTMCLNPTESLPYAHLFETVTGFMEDHTLRQISTMASDDKIDPPSGLTDDRIYMFIGSQDPVVRSETMDMLRDTYDRLDVPATQVTFRTDVPAGHSFVTEMGDVPCSKTEPDYLNLCDADGKPGGPAIDQAEEILAFLYGTLKPEVAPVAANLATFDQSNYASDVKGMDPKAFVYIPTACQDGQAECRLHIALHGCSQGRSWTLADGTQMGNRYATLTGYNGWAEANDIVVLYPQAAAFSATDFNPAHGNPKGCWDWWGYGGANYLSRTAPQMAAIAAMAAALGAPLDPQH